LELRLELPLFDVRFFTLRAFTMGVVAASLSMMSIMTMLLYYNLHAQDPKGLGFTALQAGVSLLPLCAALLALALSASSIAARFGVRGAISLGMLLVTVGSATLGVAASGGGFALLALGFVLFGSGLALPYATGPRLALSALSAEQAGQGSG